MRLRFLFPVVAAAAAACTHHNPTETAAGAHVAVRASQPGEADGVDLQLIRVDNDSRCPADVTCISAGNATVVITVRTPNTPIGVLLAQQFVNTNVDPRFVEVSGYRVTLDSLRPVPLSTHAIAQEDYVAFLTIRKTN